MIEIKKEKDMPIHLTPQSQVKVLDVQIKQLEADLKKAKEEGNEEDIADFQELLDDSVAKKEELEKQIAENPQNMDLDFLRDEA